MTRPETKATVERAKTGWTVVLTYRSALGWVAYHRARFLKRRHVLSYLDRIQFDVVDDVVVA